MNNLASGVPTPNTPVNRRRFEVERDDEDDEEEDDDDEEDDEDARTSTLVTTQRNTPFTPSIGFGRINNDAIVLLVTVDRLLTLL
tara:strand:- start:210 stop:464 length:255 start_codon:yes stop_codon:yes gene_type:complete